MKSIKIFATVGAIALLGMTGLTSCNQKNTPVDPITGNYNGEVVKTEFMINIAENVAGAANDARYMPAATVQEAHNRASFRGMDKIVLIPFDKDFSARLGKNIVLSPIGTADGTTTGKLNNANNIFYEDVAIPIGTKRFLFYGKAIDEAGHEDSNTDNTVYISNDDALKHKYGIVTANNLYGATSNPSAITFDLVKIYGTTGIPTDAQALADYAKAIANCTNTPTGSLMWKNYSTANGGNDALVDLYTKFISMQAGSAGAILAAVEDLYNTLERYQELAVSADPLVTNVMTAILNGADITAATGDASFKMKRKLEWESSMGFKDYPHSIGLPDGAAVIAWNTDHFDPVVGDAVKIGHQDDGDAVVFGKLTQFVYPPSLQYFAQSTIETATSSKKTLYNGVNNWTTILDQYTDNGTVQNTTRSVAIHDPIQYGVGKLDVVVKRGGTGGNAAWEDNGAHFGVDPVTFVYNDVKKVLKWKGLLIGGQKQVNYDFTQTTLPAAEVFVIYDDSLNGHSQTDKMVAIPNDGSTVTNHTLVFSSADNESAGAMAGDEIYIVLEMKNTLGDFMGKDGLIPEGGTFYLVGKLNSTTVNSTSASSSDHPENFNIFYKDYVTTANITLGADCLKSAYYTIPDMRSSNLELGFSVDLAWKTGLVFDVTL